MAEVKGRKREKEKAKNGDSPIRMLLASSECSGVEGAIRLRRRAKQRETTRVRSRQSDPKKRLGLNGAMAF